MLKLYNCHDIAGPTVGDGSEHLFVHMQSTYSEKLLHFNFIHVSSHITAQILFCGCGDQRKIYT